MDEMTRTPAPASVDYTDLAADLVAAYVANNPVPVSELPMLIATMRAALSGLGSGGADSPATTQKLTPAQIRKSITPDALISFEDGKPYKALKRHLTIRGITPDAYREKWGLPRDYPMVAASYSEARSAMAKSFGLGNQRRKTVLKVVARSEPVSEKPKRAGRRRKAREPAEA